MIRHLRGSLRWAEAGAPSGRGMILRAVLDPFPLTAVSSDSRYGTVKINVETRQRPRQGPVDSGGLVGVRASTRRPPGAIAGFLRGGR